MSQLPNTSTHRSRNNITVQVSQELFGASQSQKKSLTTAAKETVTAIHEAADHLAPHRSQSAQQRSLRN